MQKLPLHLPAVVLHALFAAAALAMAPAHGLAQQRSVPVMAGQNAGCDACGTVGEVGGLDPNGDGFLAVRAGPEASYAMLDKIYNSYRLYICDQSGPWLGAVYHPDGMDCGVSSPWPQAAAYRGPCHAGWVHRDYVREVAG